MTELSEKLRCTYWGKKRILANVLRERGWTRIRGEAEWEEIIDEWDKGREEWKGPDGTILDLVEVVRWLQTQGWEFGLSTTDEVVASPEDLKKALEELSLNQIPRLNR